MKCLKRNQSAFNYCLYADKADLIDEYGNQSGETILIYGDPVTAYANISPATGQSNTEQFGNLENYDKVIVTDDLNCPIDENSVLFIDKEPEFTDVITHEYDVETSEWVERTIQVPVHDYIVRRVAKSLNSISIAIRRVEVS